MTGTFGMYPGMSRRKKPYNLYPNVSQYYGQQDYMWDPRTSKSYQSNPYNSDEWIREYEKAFGGILSRRNPLEAVHPYITKSLSQGRVPGFGETYNPSLQLQTGFTMPAMKQRAQENFLADQYSWLFGGRPLTEQEKAKVMPPITENYDPRFGTTGGMNLDTSPVSPYPMVAGAQNTAQYPQLRTTKDILGGGGKADILGGGGEAEPLLPDTYEIDWGELGGAGTKGYGGGMEAGNPFGFGLNPWQELGGTLVEGTPATGTEEDWKNAWKGQAEDWLGGTTNYLQGLLNMETPEYAQYRGEPVPEFAYKDMGTISRAPYDLLEQYQRIANEGILGVPGMHQIVSSSIRPAQERTKAGVGEQLTSLRTAREQTINQAAKILSDKLGGRFAREPGLAAQIMGSEIIPQTLADEATKSIGIQQDAQNKLNALDMAIGDMQKENMTSKMMGLAGIQDEVGYLTNRLQNRYWDMTMQNKFGWSPEQSAQAQGMAQERLAAVQEKYGISNELLSWLLNEFADYQGVKRRG